MKAVLVAMSVLVSLVSVGCGASTESTGGADPEGTAASTGPPTENLDPSPDATAVFAPASTLVPPGRSAAPVDPAEACPVTDPSAIFSGDAEMMEGASMAERNLGVINRYVAATPEVSTQPYLDWSVDPPRVVVGFAGDLALHREQLTPQLADPDRVLICQVPYSTAQLQVFAQEIQQQMAPGGPVVGVGVGPSVVNVIVADGADAFVAELEATYGSAVVVEVGSIEPLLPADPSASTVAT